MSAATATNIRWGPNLTDVFDYALHPTRDGGAGNPLLIWRHTGGGTSGSKANLWDGPHYEMNQFLAYILSASREVHFDVVSMESDQYTFFEAGAPVPRSRRVMYPQTIASYQRAVRAIRATMQPLGSDPSRIGLMGASHGAWLTLMSQFMRADFAGSAPHADVRRRYDFRGYDHRPKFMWLWSLAYPDWRKLASASGITFTGATVSGTSLTTPSNDSFAHYRFSAGDQVVITSGSATKGTYTVTAKNANNDALTLATSAGSGTAAGYLSTDQTDLLWSGMLLGTKSPGNGSDGLPTYAEWDAMPASLKAAMSPQYWAEQGQIGYYPPTLFSSANVTNGVDAIGNGIHPYGNTYDTGVSGTNIHDWHGAYDLSATLAAKGNDSSFYGYTGDVAGWTSQADSRRVYDWMVARINA